jgi:2-oxoglutarate ferredoxin oxidoreductase subunit alpha
MVEGLGLAGVSETPIVINLGMRPGPATGMPTWTGQGDLLFAINASQDEFPRIVLTPGDLDEAFATGRLAQGLAQKYQLPVIIITDKHLAEDYATTTSFNSQWQDESHELVQTLNQDNMEPFARYADTETGISPRPLPGAKGGVHLANSYEHDPLGYATEEANVRKNQVDKRFKKVKAVMADPDRILPQLYGPKGARLTLVSWGSNKTTILQALRDLPEVNFIHFPWVWPFPENEFMALTNGAKKLALVEGNSQAQLGSLIRQQTGIKIDDQLLKYDGRPIWPEEIVDYAKNH